MKRLRIYTRNLFLILGLIIISVFIFSNNTSAKSLKIKYNNKTRYYTGKQVVTYIDSKKISADGTYGLVINKSLMVSYKDILVKGCKIKASYNKSKGKLTFKSNGKTVKLTIGSKVMYVNGKKKTLNQAPLKVKFIKKNKTKIMIPAKAVLTAFGYKYDYSSKSKKLNCKTPFVLYYNSSYHIYNKSFGGVIFNNVMADMKYMPVLVIDGMEMIPADSILNNTMGLDFKYDAATGAVTVSGQSLTLSKPPIMVKRIDTGNEVLMVPAKETLTQLGYLYSYNATLNNITVHTVNYFTLKSQQTEYNKALNNNALTGASADYDDKSNSITLSLTFENPVDATMINNTNNVVYDRSAFIDILGTYNLLGDVSQVINSEAVAAISINNIAEPMKNSTRINLLFTSVDNEYNISVTDNVLKIVIPEEKMKDYGVKILKPDNIEYSQISYTDDYNHLKYTVSIPGDHRTFYSVKGSISKINDRIKSFVVNYNPIKNYTDITFTTSKIQGFKSVNLINTIGFIVDDPSKVFENVVVLDAGHGGHDPGAKSNGAEEAAANLAVLYDKAKVLFDKTENFVKVYYTRTDDTYISLKDRADYAAKIGADLFVSLHMNSADSSAAKGTEVFYSTNNNSKTVNGLNSYNVAKVFLNNIITAIKTNDRGVKSANYYVIRYNSVPAVLIELGFITNSSDRAKITSPEYRKLSAEAIYNSIIEIFTAN